MLVELRGRSKGVPASRPRAWVRRRLGLGCHLSGMLGQIGDREGDDVVACHGCDGGRQDGRMVAERVTISGDGSGQK